MCLVEGCERAVLLTRAEPQNHEFAEELRGALRAQNVSGEVIEAPLARVVPSGERLGNLQDYDVLIVTSKAALRVAEMDFAGTKWLVVGAQSAQEIEGNGGEVLGVYENAEALLGGLPEGDERRFLYLRGAEVRRDLQGEIAALGRDLDEVVLYRVEDLQPDVRVFEEMLKFRRFVWPLFSLGCVRRAKNLVDNLGADAEFDLISFSDAIEDEMDAVGLKGYENVKILGLKAAPTRKNMLARIMEMMQS